MEPLLRTIFQIVTRGRNTNSYKFALLRAIADLVPVDVSTSVVLERTALAEQFVEYYWPLTVRYRLRQGIDPRKDPIVMRRIRAMMQLDVVKLSEDFPRFRSRERARANELIDRTAREAFGDVIPRFHTVRGISLGERLYDQTQSGIQLSASAARFVDSHRKLLEFMAVSAWVRFTAEFAAAPKLFEKISGETPSRRQAAYQASLQILQHGECFYCGQRSATHVDHVLPWTFVLEDKIWNLVLACQVCNCSKSDRLPTREWFEKVLERNGRFFDRRGDMPDLLARDLREWSYERLREHMLTLYEEATRDEFPVWVGPQK